MWDDPDERVAQYLFVFAWRLRLHPWDIDELSISHFDHYAAVLDEMMKPDKKAK